VLKAQMPSDEARLMKLAEAVADGLGVDWADAASSSASAEVRELVEYLHVLADVASLHRSNGSDAGVTPPPQPSGATPDATVDEADADRQPRQPLQSWGPFEIRERVGSGSFGTVYRALDPRLNREIAVKLLNRMRRIEPHQASTVVEEGRLLAQVRHPNVVSVYGADAFDGCVGLWMEFVDGKTLTDILREQGAFSAQEAALVGVDLCRALAAVHKADLRHRDIKAQNVMREAGGRIVLMDFGACEPGEAGALSSTPLRGTPLYLAPELLDGQPASAATDIYALGVLLYYLVTCAYPFESGDLEQLKRAHAAGRSRRLHDVRPDLPDGFVRTVECALAPDPKRRFSSAGAMQFALTEVLGLRFAARHRRRPRAITT
jgi:serine/threonine protein kinase